MISNQKLSLPKKTILFVKKLPLFLKILIIGGLVVGGYFFYQKNKLNQTAKTEYQSAIAEKGTLINTISASGSVSSTGNVDITTSISGTVREVFAKNGDTLQKGQEIAEIILDETSTQKQTSAWSSYLSALNSLKTTEQNKSSLELQVLKDQQTTLSTQKDVDYKDTHPVNPTTGTGYTELERQIIDSARAQAQKSLEISIAKLNNYQATLDAANAALSASWESYKQTSNIIYTPADGILSNFSLVAGQAITATSNSSGTTTSQSIGTISPTNSQTQISINLSETDAVKVEPDQKVSLTLDAYSDKTFTGKVLSIDTSGSVSSGVTNYPATILMDKTDLKVFPNMGVSATIIVSVKSNVVLIPSSYIQTQNEQSIVKVQKDGQIKDVAVELGDANDTQTEIISGINEGDTIATIVSATSSSSSSTINETSIFGSFGSGRGGGGMMPR